MFQKADAEAYFLGEKHESFLFVVVGVVAILLGLLLYFYFRQSGARGAAWPLLLIGLLQAVVGFTVYSRADDQRKDIVYKMDMNPDALQREEIPRMETVMRNFTWYRMAEIACLLAGLVLFFALRGKEGREWWAGLGVGLAIMAGQLLLADYFAETRGRLYLKGLRSFLSEQVQ